MTPENLIYTGEQKRLMNGYNHLIGRHNVLCDIETAFMNDEIASRYFEEARTEVLDSGNCGMGSMFAIAIKNMARDIAENEEDEDTDKLYSKIHELQSENRQLKQALNGIVDVVVSNNHTIEILKNHKAEVI